MRNDELYEPTAFASLPAAAQHSPLGFVTPPKCPNASQIAIEEQLGFGSFCTVHRIRAVVESYRQIQHLRGAEHVNDDEDNGKIEENGKSEGNHGFDVGQGSRNSSSAKCMSSGGGDVGGLNCDAAAALKLLAPTEGGIMGRDCSESPQDQSQRLEDQPSPLPQTDGTTMRIPSTIAQFPPPSSLLQDRVATTEERVVAVADAQANDGKTSIAELHNEPATESACVIKTLRNDLSQKMQLRGEMDIIIEAHVLSKVQHPNIVQLQTYSKAISEELTRFTRRRRRCSEVCSAGVDEEEDDHICFDFDNASDGSCSTSSSSSLAATNLQSPKALAFMYPTKEYFLIEERLYGTLQDFLRTYKLQLQISSSSLANKNEQYLQQQSMYPLSLSNSTTAVISTSKRWITSSLSGIMSLLVAGGRHGRTNSSLTDGGIADMSSSRLSLSPKKLIVSPNNDDATTNMSGKINHCNNKKDNFHLGIQMLARRIGIARDIASALQYLHDRK